MSFRKMLHQLPNLYNGYALHLKIGNNIFGILFNVCGLGFPTKRFWHEYDDIELWLNFA